jgi:hypothetical protein
MKYGLFKLHVDLLKTTEVQLQLEYQRPPTEGAMVGLSK